MERKYDVRLLDAIKARQYEETVAGVDILVKPIPEGGSVPDDVSGPSFIVGWGMGLRIRSG